MQARVERCHILAQRARISLLHALQHCGEKLLRITCGFLKPSGKVPRVKLMEFIFLSFDQHEFQASLLKLLM